MLPCGLALKDSAPQNLLKELVKEACRFRLLGCVDLHQEKPSEMEEVGSEIISERFPGEMARLFFKTPSKMEFLPQLPLANLDFLVKLPKQKTQQEFSLKFEARSSKDSGLRATDFFEAGFCRVFVTKEKEVAFDFGCLELGIQTTWKKVDHNDIDQNL